MISYDKTRPASRDAHEKPRIEGRYSGLYSRQGSDALVRLSDGLTLIIGQRGGNSSPRSSNLYLVDKTIKQGYLSNLYGQEFDDRVYRYKIEATDTDAQFLIEVLYPVKKSHKGRGNTAHV